MRVWFFLLFVIVVLLLLRWHFPHEAISADQQVRLVYLLSWLALIGSSGLISRMHNVQKWVYGLVWLAIIALLAFGYTIRNHLM